MDVHIISTNCRFSWNSGIVMFPFLGYPCCIYHSISTVAFDIWVQVLPLVSIPCNIIMVYDWNIDSIESIILDQKVRQQEHVMSYFLQWLFDILVQPFCIRLDLETDILTSRHERFKRLLLIQNVSPKPFWMNVPNKERVVQSIFSLEYLALIYSTKSLEQAADNQPACC